MQRNSFSRIGRIVAAAGLLACVAFGLSRISFNVDILKLLPTHLRQVEGLSLFLKQFAQPDELIIAYEADTPEKAEAGADEIAARLSGMPQLVKRAVSRAPWEKQPADLAQLLAFLVLNQPTEKIRELTARLSPEKAPETLKDALEKLTESVSPQEIALRSHDPYNLAGPVAESGLMAAGGAQASEFSSTDGLLHVVYVQAAKPFANYKETIAWLAEIKRIAAPWQKGGAKVGFTGEPAFVATISSSMERDMMSSGLVTLIVIALIFWLCYRRARPLFDLQGMLVLVFTLTLAAAGLFFDQLTVIGVGCAAIMIGLSVDYGYFIYQRSLRHEGTVRELQRHCAQYIAWTSGTTAAAFFALNVSSLPGLSQLGNLVGIGVIVGAAVMLTVYAPLTMRRRRQEGAQHPPSAIERLIVSERFQRAGAWATLAVVALLLGALAVKGLPGSDFSAKPLRPRHSEAYAALERLSERLTNEKNMVSLLIQGNSVDAVLERLRTAETQLKAAQKHGDASSFRSPLPIWPDAALQRANLPLLAPLANDLPRLKQTLHDAGFQDEAFALTENVLRQWAAWSGKEPPIWPDNDASRWVLRRIVGKSVNGWLALGIVHPVEGRELALESAVQGEGIYLVGWNLLGDELKRVIPQEFIHVIIGLSAIVLALLAFAFRDARALGLFVAATALVFVCLLGAMSLFGMTWNFFNLAALLLLLGTGTDYSILQLLALKRNRGDVAAARRELSLVVCLCASSAAAGFGTISWANHAGLASLGQTCALGLLIDAAISVFLLPRAWAWMHRQRKL